MRRKRQKDWRTARKPIRQRHDNFRRLFRTHNSLALDDAQYKIVPAFRVLKVDARGRRRKISIRYLPGFSRTVSRLFTYFILIIMCAHTTDAFMYTNTHTCVMYTTHTHTRFFFPIHFIRVAFFSRTRLSTRVWKLAAGGERRKHTESRRQKKNSHQHNQHAQNADGIRLRILQSACLTEKIKITLKLFVCVCVVDEMGGL